MNYLPNKYYLWYIALIQKANARCNPTNKRKHAYNLLGGYAELHHIIPRCFGGSNHSSNLVWLTAREHFIAHLFLTKFTQGNDKTKMIIAAYYMSHDPKNKGVRVNSYVYENLMRIRHVFSLGTKRSNETRQKMSEKAKQRGPWTAEQKKRHSEMRKGEGNPMYGRKDSPEMLLQKSLRMKGENNPQYGKRNTDEYKQAMSIARSGPNNPRYGVRHTDEFKESMRARFKGVGKDTILINNGVKTIRINPAEFGSYEIDGWRKGRHNMPRQDLKT